jgi:hypothetical protein
LEPPVALDGYATWEQGSGPNNLGDIHVVDLASGRDRVVRRGHVAASFLVDGPLVVWPESMRPGALTVMNAARAGTGRRVPAPLALRYLRGGLVPVSDGKELAYISGSDWQSLWWSPSLQKAPLRVVRSRIGYPIDNSVRIAGHYVFFGIQPRRFLADTTTGRYVQLDQVAWALLDTKDIVILKIAPIKANHGISDINFIPLKKLPSIPPCRRH